MQWKDWMESCLTRPLGGSLDHDEALGGCLDPDEGFFGRHIVAHHLLGGEQLDEAQLDEALGGKQGFCGRLDKLLAALLHMHSGQGLNVAPFCRVVNLLVDFFDKTDFQIHF